MAPQDPQNSGYGPGGYDSDGYNNQGQYDATYDQGSDYYIDRGDTSQTGEQAHQDAERTADAQEEGGTWVDDIVDIFTRNGRVDEAYDQQMTAQANQLAQGVDTRNPPPMMCSNYMSDSHPALKTMVTEGVDPGTVGEMGDLWITAGNQMTRFQDRVATAINASTTDWQGEGGDSARTFMADVGNWVGTAGQSAQLAGTQTNIQSESLAEAKRTMPDPVDFDAAAANRDLQSTSNPLDMMTKYANYMIQYNQQQEAHQQAAQVVGTYDSGLGSASTMPAFAKPPVMKNPNGDSGGTDSGSIGGSITNDPSVNPNGSTGPGGTGGSGSGSGSGGNPSVSIPPPSGPGGTGDGSGGGTGPGTSGPGFGGTSPSGGGPDFPGPGQFPVPGPTGPGPGTGPGGGNPNIPGGAPMPLSMGGGGGSGDDMSRRGFGGGRGFGPGGGGGFGSGSGAGGSGGMGARGMGPGGMGGAGAMAAENAAMRGGAGAGGAGGRGGGGMMGGMGGRGGKGEDDDEHQRPSFLVEGDPDAVFGTDQITAPPVIGE